MSSTSSSASTHKLTHDSLINPYRTTAAPPPTPSTQPNNHQHTTTVDALTRLLQRLPPNLSLPSRLSPRTATIPPTISLSQPKPELLSAILSASTQLGFFQLTHHPITHQLAELSESDAIALFNQPSEHKRRLFPKKNWPLGYDRSDESSEEGEEDEGDGHKSKESFCLDSRCSTDRRHQLSESETSSSLREFTRGLETLGLDVVDLLSCATGLKGVDRNKLSSLMWVSEGSAKEDDIDTTTTHESGRMYPYIVGLQYQTRCQKYSLMSDTGSVVVMPEVDSVLVTLGDIAQVWSNGRTKKVRGRAVPIMKGKKNSSRSTTTTTTTRCISMSLLVTLPLTESVVVVPLLPSKADSDGEEGTLGNGESELKVEEEDGGKLIEDGGSSKKRVFNSFSFEEYARRIYHERRLHHFKDPLDMYRIY